MNREHVRHVCAWCGFPTYTFLQTRGYDIKIESGANDAWKDCLLVRPSRHRLGQKGYYSSLYVRTCLQTWSPTSTQSNSVDWKNFVLLNALKRTFFATAFGFRWWSWFRTQYFNNFWYETLTWNVSIKEKILLSGIEWEGSVSHCCFIVWESCEIFCMLYSRYCACYAYDIVLVSCKMLFIHTFTGYSGGQCSWNHRLIRGTSMALRVSPDRILKGLRGKRENNSSEQWGVVRGWGSVENMQMHK